MLRSRPLLAKLSPLGCRRCISTLVRRVKRADLIRHRIQSSPTEQASKWKAAILQADTSHQPKAQPTRPKQSRRHRRSRSEDRRLCRSTFPILAGSGARRLPAFRASGPLAFTSVSKLFHVPHLGTTRGGLAGNPQRLTSCLKVLFHRRKRTVAWR